MPGDVVRRLIEGQDSQRGYIRNTTVTCNLQIMGKNKVICGVDSRDLVFMEVITRFSYMKMIYHLVIDKI